MFKFHTFDKNSDLILGVKAFVNSECDSLRVVFVVMYTSSHVCYKLVCDVFQLVISETFMTSFDNWTVVLNYFRKGNLIDKVLKSLKTLQINFEHFLVHKSQKCPLTSRLLESLNQKFKVNLALTFYVHNHLSPLSLDVLID